MFIYAGTNADSGEKLEKTFGEEYDAFARDNVYLYPKYIIKNEEGDIVDSNTIADEEEDASWNMMFPDDDSKEGFDVDKFYDNE